MTELETLLCASVELIDLRKKLQSARDTNQALANDNARLRERIKLIQARPVQQRSSYE